MNAHLIKKFQKNNAGAVTIEFAFMLVFLGIMLVFMADLVLVRSAMGKLDSASYSLVNIVKERNAFYDSKEEINQEDVTKLKKIAEKLLYGQSSGNHVKLAIEALTYNGTTPNDIKKYGESDCTAAIPLQKVPQLSPYSQSVNPAKRRQIPVYQVTLCMEITSPFKYFLLSGKDRSMHGIRSSSVAVAR